MKKFFENLSYMGCLLPFIIGGLFPLVAMLVMIWKACNGNIGYFILNTLAVPLVIIGAINIFRGFAAVLEKDQHNLNLKKYWHFAVYIIITIAGYVAVFVAFALFIIK